MVNSRHTPTRRLSQHDTTEADSQRRTRRLGVAFAIGTSYQYKSRQPEMATPARMSGGGI